MAIDLYWGRRAAHYAWRVLLALEFKHLPYTSHLLQFSKQEHKSPQMPRAQSARPRAGTEGRPTTSYSSRSPVLYYLDLKYPDPPIFGRTPEEAGVIMRVICEFQAYAEHQVTSITSTMFGFAAERPRA